MKWKVFKVCITELSREYVCEGRAVQLKCSLVVTVGKRQ